MRKNKSFLRMRLLKKFKNRNEGCGISVMSRISYLLFTILLLLFIQIGIPVLSTATAEFDHALELVEQGEYQRATEELELLLPKIKQGTMRNRALYVLGNSLTKQQRWGEAIEYYKQAVAEGYALSDYIKLRIANNYKAQNDYPNAIIWYRTFLRDHPNHPSCASAQYSLAQCHNEMKEHTVVVKICTQLIANKRGGYVRNLNYLSGKAYEALAQWDNAHRAHQRVIDSNTDDDLAVSALNKITTLVDEHPHLKITRSQRMTHGMVLFNARQYTQAREQFRKVIANYLDKLAGKTTYFIGQSYARQRKYDAAIKEYQKIVHRYSGSNYLTRALYQTARCYRRKGQSTKANQLLKDFVAKYSWSLWADDALYDIATSLKNRAKYADAITTYTRLTRKYTKSKLVDDALWNIGWCYFKQKQYSNSIATFHSLITRFPKSVFTPRAQYCIGKGYERLHKWADVKRVYERIIRANHQYYSIKAQERTQWLVTNHNVKGNPTPDYRRIKISSDDVPRGTLDSPRFQELISAKAYDDAITELKYIVPTNQQNRHHIYYNLIICYKKTGQFAQAIRQAFRLSLLKSVKDANNAAPRELYTMLYPFYHQDIITQYSREYNLDPFFVASMIREESSYDKNIISHAGAYGLMQIMPYTGRDIAKQLKIRQFNANMLFQPEVNIRMGIWYIQNLMKTFNNNYALVAGAYNAGPGKMKQWLQQRDKSNTEKQDFLVNLDEFIEDIPIDETRRHIKRVMDSYYIYKELYGGA